jgi:histone deacetylase complex regulatory component SIN3
MKDMVSGEEKIHELKKTKVNRLAKGARGGHNKKMDRKENVVRGLDIVDRGLVHSEHNGPPMEFHIDKGKRENMHFLPSSAELNAVMYGTVNFYSFFRHFHCLYERLIKARVLATKGLEEVIEGKIELRNKYANLTEEKKKELQDEQYEEIYIRGLNALIHGNIDTAKYEDFCRHCLGPQAYLMFSLDKLINSVLFLLYH